jgi:FkbM family methyltransferase
MIKKFLEKIFNVFAGKKKYQRIFEFLHRASLKGMNIGAVAGPYQSGEQPALRHIHGNFKDVEKWILFDVGAHAGDYTLLLKEVFGNNSMVYSFEPARDTFHELESNLTGQGNVRLCNFGLGDKQASLTLYSTPASPGLASLYQRQLDHYNIRMDRTEEVEIRTIDDFCNENGINHIHILKLDVEGHEISVLKGASKMINSGKIDFIQYEFGGTDIDSRVFFRDFYYLLKDRYDLYRIVKDGLYKIEGYTEIYENFMSAMYMAKRKDLNIKGF